MEATSLLQGIRVIEVATMVFGPSAGAVLADFGAEVIKVEPPGLGDLNRYYHKLPGMPVSEIAYTFEIDNRNKKGLALDVKHSKGSEIMAALVRSADVFVTNYRPGAIERLGLTYSDLEPINPRLIYALGSAYGERGDERDAPGYDNIAYWARSAIESQVFPMRDWPGPFPFGSGDHPSGMTLYAGIMSALYSREKTGRGSKVSTSLLANGAWANAIMLQAELCGARFNERVPREKSYNFTYLHYRTADDRIIKLGLVNEEKHWSSFCRAMGCGDLIEDLRFATREARCKHMEELIRILDGAFLRGPADHWVAVLSQCDFPFVVLPTYVEAANDPQKAASDIVIPIEHPRHGSFRTVNSPIEIGGIEKTTPGAAPELGEHSREVLDSLGYSETQIQELVEIGVIGVGPGS